MKTYVLTVSRHFPVTYPKAGQATYFVEKILNQLFDDKPANKRPIYEASYMLNPNNAHHFMNFGLKMHTIRGNYDLWAKRIKEVQEGNAILSLRYWSGKPYNSKQVEFAVLDKDSGIGVQSIQYSFDFPNNPIIDGLIRQVPLNQEEPLYFANVANNDGLSIDDFKAWFKGYDLLIEPMAIIHFTKFRY